MFGYVSEVVMVGGIFIDGSIFELFVDGLLWEFYIVFC